MYARAFACDFDGTTATSGTLAPEFLAAAGRARAAGWSVILATGRLLDELRELCGDLSMFDAVVAENGGLVHLPDRARTIQIGERPPEEFLRQLRAAGVPFHTGSVIVGTWESHLNETFALMRRHAPGRELIFNRGAIMVLPAGINKATGVRRALAELQRSERNLIAFGDAENDVALFDAAELGVAAAGSVPAVAACADDRLSLGGGSGVARYINEVLDAGGHLPTPARHHVTLGTSPEGGSVVLPSSGINVMVSGDPRAGKSWLSGLIAEQLLSQGYRLCVLDAEGDHRSLAQRPGVLCFGAELELPTPTAVPRLLREHDLSVVLSLNSLTPANQRAYTTLVLEEVGACAAEAGMPQWIFVDEAQYFLSGACVLPQVGASNLLLSTYRPSLIADEVLARIDAHVITRTAVEEERYFVSSLLRQHCPDEMDVCASLAKLDREHVGLVLERPGCPRWQVFRPLPRATTHTHHGAKYADTRLSDDKAFRFGGADGGPNLLAHNVGEFYRALATVPQGALRHHMTRADFSRWATEVLGDQSLARGLRKLERASEVGAEPNRFEILMQIESLYDVHPSPS
jgi:hydroxymethylpyrimidine pyrophosphatase-like HAD family hydrolase